MAHFVVGRKGFLKSSLEFTQAINAANDGDIIELEEGYSPFFEQNNTHISITKSITIEGHLVKDTQTGRISANIIDGVFVGNGAHVVLRNLEIRKDVDKSNNIKVYDGSALEAENIILTSHASEGANYPVVYVENNSQVMLRNIELLPGNIHDRNYKIYAEGSTLGVHNSIVNASIRLSNAKLNCQNSIIKYLEANALLAEKGSVITASQVTFEGGSENGKSHWHCIKLLDSSFTAANISVNQPKSSNIAAYAEKSTVAINNSVINSRIFAVDSKLDCQNSNIKYFDSNALFAKNNCIITAENTVFEGGLKSEKTNYPCVRLVDSQFTATDIEIRQPNYSCALDTQNAKIRLNSGRYDSLSFTGSEVSLGAVGVIESIAIYSNSHVKAEEIDILGKDNGKINLYLNKGSSLEADIICFGKLSVPNVRAERNTTLNVGEMQQLEYDLEAEVFVTNEEGTCTVIGDVPDIDYFGEMTALQRLDQMIGLRKAKEAVLEFIAIAELNKKREAQGLKNSGFSLHCMFLGNPGTGKTTVARLIAEILYEKGVIKTNNLVETSRSDLVGGYIGQTALKTREVLESALDGVLFIDEAYTLWKGPDNSQDFGAEAIDEILKFMEDHRTDIVLIFAGYTHSMEKFLESNEGLRSRIPNSILFEDYTEDELIQIGLASLYDSQYKIDETEYADLVRRKYAQSYDNSNGRWVRNLNELLIRKMAVRISATNADDIFQITQEDINAV